MFTISYLTEVAATAADNTSNYTSRLETTSVAADYTSKLTFEITAGSETQVPLPAINSLKVLSIQASAGVDYSLMNDQTFQAIYQGAYFRNIALFFGDSGIVYDHLKVKANDTTDAIVTITFAGSEALPS